VLARNRLLKYVDYLSTVSGGGYLGSCLSSLLARASRETLDQDHFPLRKQIGEPEPLVLRHLRNGSNYLRPPGLFNVGFNGLVTLLRFARIDLGISINIDPEKLRKEGTRTSRTSPPPTSSSTRRSWRCTGRWASTSPKTPSCRRRWWGALSFPGPGAWLTAPA